MTRKNTSKVADTAPVSIPETETAADRVKRLAKELADARKARDEAKKVTPRSEMTRVAVASRRVREGGELAVIVAEADVAYAETGGSLNEKESKWAVRMAVDVLSAIGEITRKGSLIVPAKPPVVKVEE